MLRALFVSAFFLAACEPTSPEESEISASVTASEILATAPVVFAHDHLWNHDHLKNARDGKLTATTIDLTVDTLPWRSGHCSTTIMTACADTMQCPGGETCIKSASDPLAHTCCIGYGAEDPTENIGRNRFDSEFDNATNGLTHEMDVVNQDAGVGAVRFIDKAEDIDTAKAANALGIIVGTEGALVVRSPGDVLSNGDGDVLTRVESPPKMTLTDSAGLFLPAHVGKSIAITGSSVAGNNGPPFPSISAWLSSTQIQFLNTNTARATESPFTGSWFIDCTEADEASNDDETLLSNTLRPRVDDLFTYRHWRKATLVHSSNTEFLFAGSVSCAGKVLVATLNRRGVAIDVTHLNPVMLAPVLGLSNAPLYASHLWARGYEGNSSFDADMRKIAASGGGHGVIALNALGTQYGPRTLNCMSDMECDPDKVNNPTGLICFNGKCSHEKVPLGCNYTYPVNEVATLQHYVERIDCLATLVGVDHVAIGPDFMPSGDMYAIGGHTRNTPPNLHDDITALVQALLSQPRADGTTFSEADVRKIIGGNLRDFYQRVWDPTHNYDGGNAHLRLCANGDTSLACVAAASNRGQGDLRHRAINCASGYNYQPVGLQLFYDVNGTGDALAKLVNTNTVSLTDSGGGFQAGHLGSKITISGATPDDNNGTFIITAVLSATQIQFTNPLGSNQNPFNGKWTIAAAVPYGAWHYYDISGGSNNCPAGSTLVASWGDGESNNARIAIDGTITPPNHCDSNCLLARNNVGAGTWNSGTNNKARALSCVSVLGPGIVGLQLSYSLGGGAYRWRHYTIFGQLSDCLGFSTLVATWDTPGTPNMKVQLCDDRGSDSSIPTANAVCVAAAANGGTGTGLTKALNCLNSDANSAAYGTVALQVVYTQDPVSKISRWFYYDIAGQPHRCLHGSVLVAAPIP